MFSHLKLKIFCLALKVRAYLLTHHSLHHFNANSKMNVLLLRAFHFIKSLMICPFHLFLQLEIRTTIQVMRHWDHLFSHPPSQHPNFHSSQTPFTWRTLDSNTHRECSETRFWVQMWNFRKSHVFITFIAQFKENVMNE